MKNELIRIAQAKLPDPEHILMDQLAAVRESMESRDSLIRPRDVENRPGGLIFLHQEIPLIVLPDLHARKDFLMELLLKETLDGSVLNRLEEGSLQLLCVGDGFHAERRAYKRWQKALGEYKTAFRRHKTMDLEMGESLGLMQMVMLLKSHCPDNFFFLKGNHENILNEEGRGNHPFGKFVFEGEMVRTWAEKFMSPDCLYDYADFEHSLPFMALGKELIISHAEPGRYYHPEEIINIHDNPDVKLGLTWTANDESEEGSVENILRDYSRRFSRDFSHCIAGHRTIRSLYKLRASGHLVQIHNPDRHVVLYTDQTSPFDPERNIKDLQQMRRLPV